MAFHETIKRSVKTIAKPVALAARPTVEKVAFQSARLTRARQGLKVVWADTWTPTMDEALDHLPPPPGVSRDQYRELLLPTQHEKRHALVLEKDTPISIVSMRKRANAWEPVSYQALSGFVAPATDYAALGRAINSLGIELKIESGLGKEALEIGARHAWPYDVVRVFLQTDYEEHWLREDRKHMKYISSARSKCKRMHLVVDNEGDLEWTVNQWETNWASSAAQETVAAPDRIRFWKSLRTTPEMDDTMRVHTYVLYDGDKPVSGAIATSIGANQLGQCLGQLHAYRNRGVGTRVLDAALSHASAAGYEIHDFGGGHGYKSLWGPVATQRYSATFRPKLLESLQWSRDYRL
tara:strand:- start:6223 stop:7278 length:1056 start_codon:yes stop_codon:yes gene_type:complete